MYRFMIARTHKYIFSLILTCFFCISYAIAQKKDIEIIEVKTKKKITFYAKNNTDIPKEVFLKIDGKGFRKSSYRPVIKKVPPNKKVLLTVLIPLKGTTPEYTYFSSFDDQLDALNLKTPEVKHWKTLDHLIDKGETIIFTKDDCAKCEKLIGMLKANRIQHKEFNISKHERYKDFFWSTLTKVKRKDVIISAIPVAIVKGKLHEGIQLIPFIEMLKK